MLSHRFIGGFTNIDPPRTADTAPIKEHAVAEMSMVSVNLLEQFVLLLIVARSVGLRAYISGGTGKSIPPRRESEAMTALL